MPAQILCSPLARQSPALAFESPAMRQKYFRHVRPLRGRAPSPQQIIARPAAPSTWSFSSSAQVSEGGWPFSSSAHGWPISDCTAEGLKAVLCLRSLPCIQERCAPISDERLFKALRLGWKVAARPA